MMIEILQEITDWGEEKVANGIYHIKKAGHCVKHNDKFFNKPLKQFSKPRRKFKKIVEPPVCMYFT